VSEAQFSPYTILSAWEVVSLYYDALYSGDLGIVRELMTEKSYFMTLETFGLRLAFRDAEFKEQLGKIEEDSASLVVVESRLSADLATRKPSPQIKIISSSWNGHERQTVEYTEEDKMKKLYLSKEESGWKINYYAGRKVD
jgi:hypothetical protein